MVPAPFFVEEFHMRVEQDHLEMIIVSVDNAIRHHLLTNDRQNGLSLGIRNHLSVDLTFPLQNAKDGHLACSSTASFPFASSPKVGLINFQWLQKTPIHLRSAEQ